MTQPQLIVDSNIVIYSIEPQYQFLRNWMLNHRLAASGISLLEVMGFHKLTAYARQEFTQIFQQVTVLPLLSTIVDRAILLRQTKKMSLGDALVAATALEHQLKLVSRNKGDFIWIPGLQVFDPFDPADFQQIV
ncbi:MAG: type II toxin-antitoxin system VapC family toxin [Acidobacteria bacterium]|nr:type II toxin-antitoxin system VapC family toxin [Acidobacteriota bacterium]